MPAFQYQLVLADGTPAEPPTLESSLPRWRTGDAIPLGPGKTLRVIGTVAGKDPDGRQVLIVEPV
jgi:hypothetical protein